jgi:hypothetical protein
MNHGRGWRRFGFAMVLAVVGSCFVAEADADLGGTVTYGDPAGTLVMPFDSTSGKVSFQHVIRIGGPDAGAVATHWVYWAADCKHLADVVICLTPRDTVVVDPTALQAEIQKGNENQKLGPKIDLSGKRGVVTVTAYETDTGSSGKECHVPDQPVPLNQVIVGSWTIANTSTNTGYGGDAIGFPVTGVFPDPAILSTGGLRIPTYNPETLSDSQVIVLPLKYPGGSGIFTNEVGPLSKVTCDSTFFDNLEAATSLPRLTLKCVGFNPISSATAHEGGDTPIIPDTFTLDSSGHLQLTNCRTSSGILSGKKFVFAFHAEAVGPFGTTAAGKYTNLLPD